MRACGEARLREVIPTFCQRVKCERAVKWKQQRLIYNLHQRPEPGTDQSEAEAG